MGNRTTPSVVAFTETHRLIGEAAKAQITTNPQNTVFDAKRLIGRKFHDQIVQNDLKHWPFKLVADEHDNPIIQVQYMGETKNFTCEQISSMVLSKMKQTAENYLGEKVTNAIITVPAYFNDSQRQSTKDAGLIAGLNVLRIINEPTAAALAYGLDKLSQSGRRYVLIFDLGGGTFDVSLLAIEKGYFEVLATNGDTHLGGEDFDNNLVDFCIKEFRRKYHRDPSKAQSSIRRLRSACERAKRILSSEVSTTIEVESMYDGQDLVQPITRAKFEELNLTLFKNTLNPVRKVLADANLNVRDIHDVVLVGGSTRIPKVQELLSDFFNGKQLYNSVDQDEAVAYGAAVQGSILIGSSKEISTDLILLDVVPLSLGVETAGGVMTKIIPRNSTIPTRRMKMFTTNEDFQEEVEVQVFEGERPFTKDNNKLASFILTGLPHVLKGVPHIEVTFDIDSNGILQVTAVENSTGTEAAITVINDKNHLKPEEIAKMIEDAEMFQVQDEEKQGSLKKKSELETYLYKVNKMLRKSEIKKSMPKEMRDALRGEIGDILDWIEENPEEKGEVYEKRMREFERKAELKIAPFRVFDDDFKPYMVLENGAIIDRLD
ncbi:uncharacterized protein [Blastocystis hominis]|uniref:Heat shock protein 70 n=1 Tax=Blastocystis hominis TaxID=12968 RepID=D8M904_BLAHO|nr:uncharacterized protein [Blastocystis hominis]CBK24543.2 unnamed protein product [Blastocystis hominis]|eukprot:XP_012898591.1 uncharacterized protein [Blastocystis hominis]